MNMSTAEQTQTAPPVEAAIVQDMQEVGIMPRREATVMELAAVIAGSRDFPDCRTPEKAAVRILAGQGMGVEAIASVIGIRINAGRVSMDATLMAGCIKRSGRYDYKVTAHTNEVCAIVFFENGEPAGESAFSMADAKQAGLEKKETWKGYPRNMLFARALSNGARWYCPAIFGGSIYTHEELGITVDEEGRAVENESGNGNGAGNELCTREQRQAICRLVEAVGDSMPGFMAKMGVRLLDELSGYEADKEIKRLEKRAAKAGVPLPMRAETSDVTPSDGTVLPSAAAPVILSLAQQTIADGFDESRQPSTPNQRDAIIGLAQFLVPDENDCHEMLVNALAKRNCHKLAELNHLQAEALIEALQAKTYPPFPVIHHPCREPCRLPRYLPSPLDVLVKAARYEAFPPVSKSSPSFRTQSSNKFDDFMKWSA
jgi:hypothetical protein